MKSYLALTPPDGQIRDENSRFILDGYSWLAFFFPVLWSLFNRLYWIGIVAALFQAIGFILIASNEYSFWGCAGVLALRLILAFEGRSWLAQHLEARGWRIEASMLGRNIQDAEAQYFDDGETVAEDDAPLVKIPNGLKDRGRSLTGQMLSIGQFDHNKGYS